MEYYARSCFLSVVFTGSGTFRPKTISSPSRFAPSRFPPGRFPTGRFAPLVVSSPWSFPP